MQTLERTELIEQLTFPPLVRVGAAAVSGFVMHVILKQVRKPRQLLIPLEIARSTQISMDRIRLGCIALQKLGLIKAVGMAHRQPTFHVCWDEVESHVGLAKLIGHLGKRAKGGS